MRAALLAINTDGETNRRLKNYCAAAGYLFAKTRPENSLPEIGRAPDIII